MICTLYNERFFCEFSKKSDYEKSQTSNPNMQVVAQPLATITQPMSNIENQFVQPQALLVPSYASMLNSSQGQIYTETTPLPNIIHSNQTSSESIMTNSNEGQVSARTMTSPSPKPGVKPIPGSFIQPSSASPTNNKQNLPLPISEIEPLQLDCSEA